MTAKRQQPPEAKITDTQKQEMITEIISMQMRGEARSVILAYLIANYPLSPAYLQRFIDLDAKEKLMQDVNTDAMQCIDIHTILYEEIYNFFYSIRNTMGMNRALAAKEKMLGFHREDKSVIINNKIKIKEERVAKYELKKLNPEQQSKLGELLNKCKKKAKT